jgi:hypothetical protein
MSDTDYRLLLMRSFTLTAYDTSAGNVSSSEVPAVPEIISDAFVLSKTQENLSPLYSRISSYELFNHFIEQLTLSPYAGASFILRAFAGITPKILSNAGSRSSAQQYPPKSFTYITSPGPNVYNVNITGSAYGNGAYSIKESSSYSDYSAWQLFSNINTTSLSDSGWFTLETPVGVLNIGGDTYTNVHWVQIQLPTPITLSKITMFPRLSYVTRMPAQFYIYGSNDETDWTKIYTSSAGLSWTNAAVEFAMSSTTSYSYFKLVSSSLVNMSQLKLYGVQGAGTSSFSLTNTQLATLPDYITTNYDKKVVDKVYVSLLDQEIEFKNINSTHMSSMNAVEGTMYSLYNSGFFNFYNNYMAVGSNNTDLYSNKVKKAALCVLEYFLYTELLMNYIKDLESGRETRLPVDVCRGTDYAGSRLYKNVLILISKLNSLTASLNTEQAVIQQQVYYIDKYKDIVSSKVDDIIMKQKLSELKNDMNQTTVSKGVLIRQSYSDRKFLLAFVMLCVVSVIGVNIFIALGTTLATKNEKGVYLALLNFVIVLLLVFLRYYHYV